MAKEVITRLRDDLTGKPIEDGEGESISFGFDGKNYEIDLEKTSADKFRKQMTLYVEHASEVVEAPPAPATPRRRTSTPASSEGKRSKEELASIREWARANGHEINDRGRIAATITEAYEEAHK